MISVDSTRHFAADAVVIGSGAGGAPAAAILAGAGLDVLVLEAGPRLGRESFSGVEREMTARLIRLDATDSGISLYAGACVGGSTVINDALCWRTPAEVLEEWRTVHGLVELTEEAMAPFVDEAWTSIHASETGRDHMNRNAYRLELGARRLGWAGGAVPRSVRNCANLGLCNFGCPANAKQSMLLTWVPRAETAGARVLDGVRVEEIRIRDGRVHGVRALRLADDGTIREELEIRTPLVVVAAGVLETPALLRRSGIDAAGGGIQFHTTCPVTARFREPIHGYFGPTMAYAVTEFADVKGHRGPGFMLENAAVHPANTANGLPGFGPVVDEAMSHLPHLARALVVLRDRARGRTGDDGAIAYALLREDLDRLRDGMLAIARAYLAADAEAVYLPVNGFPIVRKERDLDALARTSLETGAFALLYAVHLFGGAAMGDGGVCDAEGRVRGVGGLHVADASVLPTNTGVNPQVTIIANAIRIARSIVASRGRTA